jgi:ubiquinone/menaquinone biosynthesis C-methylase UbiE
MSLSNEETAKAVAVSAAAFVVAVGFLWKIYLRQVFFAKLLGKYVAPEANRRLADRKKKLFARMEELKAKRGDGRLVVVDVGSGSGINFRFYPEGSEVICVDPNRHFEPTLRAGSVDWPGVRVVDYLATYCEKMREVIEPEVADAVVVSELLCCVSNVDLCLKEILRILKPGGKAFFLEHVLSPPCYPHVRLLQQLTNFIWCFIFGGCNINRTTEVNIRRAGFSEVDLEEFEAFELEQPTKVFCAVRMMRTRLYGTATRDHFVSIYSK